LSLSTLKLLTCSDFNWGQPFISKFRNKVGVIAVRTKTIENKHLRPFCRRFPFNGVNSVKAIVMDTMKLRRDTMSVEIPNQTNCAGMKWRSTHMLATSRPRLPFRKLPSILETRL
jgi:hypothetical protein